MGWSSRSGRARTSLTNPEAFSVSDRDGAWRNRSQMVFQKQWAGNDLVDLRLLVGIDEYDEPNMQLRNPQLPPDPVPIQNPRPEPFFYDATGGNTVVNWDTPGATWDSGLSWDNTVEDTPAEVPD